MRYFTPQEANAFVPALSATFADISRLRRRIVRWASELVELGAGTDFAQPLPSSAPEPVRERRKQIDSAVRKIRRLVVDLEAHGVIVKELDGEVDFWAMRSKRPVFLSWKLGQDQVDSWHEPWTDVPQPVDAHFPKPLLN